MLTACVLMGGFLPESFATALYFGPRGGRSSKFAYLLIALVQNALQDGVISHYVRRKSGVNYTRFYCTPFKSFESFRRHFFSLIATAFLAPTLILIYGVVTGRRGVLDP